MNTAGNVLIQDGRYGLPQRVHNTTIYPVKAPNGSTIVLTGTDTGVTIAWRGGRPLKKAAPPSKQPAKPAKVNGTSNDAIMIIDSDDDEPPPKPAAPAPKAEFGDEEEELDPDQPYPSFVQQLHLSLHTQVLHTATPQIPAVSPLRTADTIPAIFSTHIVFAVACADCAVRVITLPLGPPPDSIKEKPLSPTSQFGEDVVKILGHQSISRGVTMTWTSRSEPSSKDTSDDDMDVDAEDDPSATPGRRRRKQQSRSDSRNKGEGGFDLLVASHSAELGGLLKVWRFQLADASVTATYPVAPYKTLNLRKPASRVAFNTAHYPKRRHSQLLIADSTGTARIYDAFAPSSRKRRASGSRGDPGAFTATFRSTFEPVKSDAFTPAILAGRKPIVDAAWASDGCHIVALLADGEWGVWDVDRSGPSPPADPAAFSLRGFVGTAEKDTTGGPSSPKRLGRGSLAPMTPNTRRKKEETLFQGSSLSTAVTTRGGISVAALSGSNGAAAEDSVLIWYGSDIYRIADLAKFWSRTASASNGNSLPSPGLAQIQDISLLGEAITSISQFDTTLQASRMAIPRDTLISTEHRIIIITSASQPLGRDLNGMFAQEQAETEDARRTDQALLNHGELDIGGMDRLLDSIEGSGSLGTKLILGPGNPRKVLFASSTAA